MLGIEGFFPLLFMLIVGHFIADFPLQGDFLSRGKNHKNPIPGVPWYQCLAAHVFIHAGMVFIITGSMFLAICELITHTYIDYLKCNEELSFNQDQLLHIWCKFVWVFVFFGWL